MADLSVFQIINETFDYSSVDLSGGKLDGNESDIYLSEEFDSIEATCIDPMDPECVSYYPDFSQIWWIRVLYIVLYLFEFLVGVIGNLMVCVIVYKNKSLHSPVNYYIVNLGVTDLLVEAIVLPIKLFQLTSDAEINFMTIESCAVTRYIESVLVFASVFTLVAVCIERYFAIVHPFRSRANQTHSRIRRALFLVWIIPIVVASPNLYPGSNQIDNMTSEFGSFRRHICFDGFKKEFRFWYFLFLFVFIFIIPFLLILMSCAFTTLVLIRKIPAQIRANEHSLSVEKGRRKVAKMIMVLALIFFICWSPYFLVTVVTQFQESSFLHRGQYFFTMLTINLMCFTNSCINPLIYFAMSNRFRKGFLSFFPSRFLSHRQNSRTRTLCSRDSEKSRGGDNIVTGNGPTGSRNNNHNQNGSHSHSQSSNHGKRSGHMGHKLCHFSQNFSSNSSSSHCEIQEFQTSSIRVRGEHNGTAGGLTMQNGSNPCTTISGSNSINKSRKNHQHHQNGKISQNSTAAAGIIGISGEWHEIRLSPQNNFYELTNLSNRPSNFRSSQILCGN